MANPQALNRYSYVQNKPVIMNDPTGHRACDDEYDCGYGSANNVSRNLNKEGDKASKEKQNRKPGEPLCKGEHCREIEDTLTYVTGIADVISWAISAGEAAVADFAYGVATVGCIASEGVGCGPLYASAWLTDKAAATFGGVLENNLGLFSTGVTIANDALQGNFGYDKKIGLYVGKDSVVSTRNTVLGFIPNSNLDLAISTSQLKYDRDRFLNNFPGGNGKPGGYVPLFSLEFLTQLTIKDWW